ncbi:MAG TPA: histidine kinase dimerization/phospho-acceptor domain-containing protein [Candidatus Solibacter sp.]|nr:histidine kinase dimerization/phospho-acceptor domain-containing protein [Candidatus Solibacter sp.]
MNKGAKIWLGGVAAILAIFVATALLLPRSFALAAFCDISGALLLASGAASFVPLAKRSRGRMRLFWSLIILGVTLWLSYQLMWIYYEVILRREVPDIFTGDIVLFLNLVPLMAALALRPHVPRDEYSARLGRLDFALLLVWWFYLYVLVVLPWQYAIADVATYSQNLNAVYLTEKGVLLTGLAINWFGSKGHWRRLYASLFGMSLCYSASSALANWAIARRSYYSGSFYDIPLEVAMAWVTWIGLRTKAEEPQADGRDVSIVYGVWVARFGTIAVFSLPLFAAWVLADGEVPTSVRSFRLALTLIAAFVMGTMIFIRQILLDRELIALLRHSRDSVDNLKHLQAQILQSEKLASIGQLVGGAAHELNNPITAMLGYSDLLLSTPLSPEHHPLAAKIGQHVRRTKSLVASLISFARQAPAPKTAVDLNTLARTALKLTEPQFLALRIEPSAEFDNALPKVLGDSNQLLQVCLQLIGNCLHVMGEQGGKILTLSTSHRVSSCILRIETDERRCSTSDSDASNGNSREDVALSACQGILQEHNGNISREIGSTGATLICVEMPAIEGPLPKTKPATVPVLWQSQPYA